jgi:hypothetical protein
LPHDLDNERRLIGVSKFAGAAARLVLLGVTAESFYRLEYRPLWAEITALAVRGATPDVDLIAKALEPREVEAIGAMQLAELFSGVPRPTDGNLDLYAETHLALAQKRQQILALDRARAKLMEADEPSAPAILELGERLRAVGTPRATALLDDVSITRQKDRPHLVDGRIGCGELVAIVAASGSGKSHLKNDLFLQMTIGGLWQGARIGMPGAALDVTLEGRAGLKGRVQAWKLHNGCEPDHRLGVSYYTEDLSLVDPTSVDRLIAAARQIPDLRIVGIDTYTRALIPGDENSSKDTGIAVAALDRIREATGATVVAVHHLIHDGSRERGSTALRAAVDTLVKVTVREGGVREVTCEKSRDLAPFEPFYFTLVPVGPSCVPVTTSEPPLNDIDQRDLDAQARDLVAQYPTWSNTQLALRLGGRKALALDAIRRARESR